MCKKAITLPKEVHIVKAPSRHARVCELDSKEGRALKNRYFQTVVLEKTLESPLDSKEIEVVNLKGNQPSIFIGRSDA